MKNVRKLMFSAVFLAVAGVFVVAGTTNDLSAQTQVKKYSVDSVHSSILFKVKHANAAFLFGRFRDVIGSVSVNSENPSESSVNLNVKAESVYTAKKKRDNHLRSPDFLNVKQYPEISFESTSVKKTSGGSYEVTGDFSLHGVTKELTVDVEKTGEGKGPEGNPRIGFYTEFDIQRSEFGMTKYPNMIGDTVTLIISIEGVQK